MNIRSSSPSYVLTVSALIDGVRTSAVSVVNATSEATSDTTERAIAAIAASRWMSVRLTSST